MKRSYFITATGTDLGKTWLTAGVAGVCKARGIPVRALKPVMSGYDPARHAESDAAKVGPGETVDSIAPWRFAAPLSPDLAAAREGRQVDFDALVGWCRGEIERNPGLLLIEGIGGAMVPLDKTHTVREWIAALGIQNVQAVLVAGTYLGALSHALATLAALRAAGIEPAALVVNESADSPVGLSATLASLAHHVGEVPLLAIKRDDAAGLERVTNFLLGSGK
jgi:dethiobiotin synthetase